MAFWVLWLKGREIKLCPKPQCYFCACVCRYDTKWNETPFIWPKQWVWAKMMIPFNTWCTELSEVIFPQFLFFVAVVFKFWGAFSQKQAISKQKVQLCYLENVEMVYFDISELPPPCAFQMKLFVRHILNLWRHSVPPGLRVSSHFPAMGRFVHFPSAEVTPECSEHRCLVALARSGVVARKAVVQPFLTFFCQSVHHLGPCLKGGQPQNLSFPRDWNRHG